MLVNPANIPLVSEPVEHTLTLTATKSPKSVALFYRNDCDIIYNIDNRCLSSATKYASSSFDTIIQIYAVKFPKSAALPFDLNST